MTPEQREHYARDLIVELLVNERPVNIGRLNELITIARVARFAQDLERIAEELEHFSMEEGMRIALEPDPEVRIEAPDEDH